MNRYTSPITGGRVILSHEAAHTWRAEIATRTDGRRSVRGLHTDTADLALAFIHSHQPEAASSIARQMAAF